MNITVSLSKNQIVFVSMNKKIGS